MAGVATRGAIGPVRSLSSLQNPAVRLYRTLARERVLEGDRQLVLLEGLHLLIEARAAGLSIKSAAFDRDLLTKPSIQSLAHALVAEGSDVLAVPTRVLAAVSPARTPSGVVSIAACSAQNVEAIFRRPRPLIVVTVDVQDPGNLGAIVRACEAGGGTGVVSCGASADPFSWKALRGSMGSAFRLPVSRANFDAAVVAGRAAGLRLFATVPRGGRALFDLDLTQPFAVIVGGEGSGLSPHVLSAADAHISIPMEPPVESLNVAISAALIVYEGYRQRLAASAVQASRESRSQES